MNSASLDLIGFGEALVEFYETSPGTFIQGYAGDILNTLFYASRLGLRAGLVSTLGNDPFTAGLEKMLTELGVDKDCLLKSSDRSNGIYFVRSGGRKEDYYYIRSDSAARYTMVESERDRLISYCSRPSSIFFSAITLAVFKQVNVLIEVLPHSKSEHVVFDANVRARLWNNLDDLVQMLPKLASFVTVFCISEEDDQLLFGARNSEIALSHYAHMGYRTIVYRQGNAPTILFTAGQSFSIPIMGNIRVRDTTGAGDAFNAGLMYGLSQNWPLVRSVLFGNATAAAAIEGEGGCSATFTRERTVQLFAEIDKSLAGSTAY